MKLLIPNWPRLAWSAAIVAALAGCHTPKPASPDASGARAQAATADADASEEAGKVLDKILSTPPVALPAGNWTSMFDGRTLTGWRKTDFAGKGSPSVRDGVMVLSEGNYLSGVNWTNEPPRMNYELTLEAARLTGQDFFCGLTFPVRTNSCTLVMGGWGGALIGLSSLDNLDASENETTQTFDFENGRWYRIRIRVTPARIEAWLDDKRVINVEIAGRYVGMRAGEIELAMPLGISTFATTAAIRNAHYRRLD